MKNWVSTHIHILFTSKRSFDSGFVRKSLKSSEECDIFSRYIVKLTRRAKHINCHSPQHETQTCDVGCILLVIAITYVTLC